MFVYFWVFSPCWLLHLQRFLSCLLIFLIVSFTVQKLLSLIRSHCFIFVFFLFIILGGGLNKILLWYMSKRVLPMFSTRSFILSGLTFRSSIHLSLFLCMVLENVLISSFYIQLFMFSRTTYWRACNSIILQQNPILKK